MSDVLNPYIAGSPVSGTEMFFGRGDVFDFVKGALSGRHRDNIIVLYGQRRTGKTSVLYQMSRHLDARYLCIFVDLHSLALDGLEGFLWELASTMVRVLRREHGVELPRPRRADFEDDPRGAFAGDFLDQVGAAIGDRHVLLMLDEVIRLQEQVDAGKLEREIFDYLRSLMQHQQRINFLFSLGSGLEELANEYTKLFNVALYKKISFLARPEAVALIREPVRPHYAIDDAALSRILRVTSGHPYFTQLICHQLFTRWQERKMAVMHVEDVEAVLNDAVERGVAVLKQVWDESTPAEKAVIAAIAATTAVPSKSIAMEEIRSIWASLDVDLPESELNRALRLLVRRDVLEVQRGEYGFTIDLQRRWAQQQCRLEWTKEEISEAIAAWRASPGEAQGSTSDQPTTAPFVPSSLPSLDWSEVEDEEESDATPTAHTNLPALESPEGAAILERVGLAETSRVLHASARASAVPEYGLSPPDPTLTVIEKTVRNWGRAGLLLSLILIAIFVVTTAVSTVVQPLLFPPSPTPGARPTAVVQAPVAQPPAPTAAVPATSPPAASSPVAAPPASPAPSSAPVAASPPVPAASKPVADGALTCGTERRALLSPGGSTRLLMGIDLTANHDEGRPETVGILVTSEGLGGDDPATKYRTTLDYLKNPSKEASYHVLIGPSAACELVKDADTAWAGGNHLDRTHLFLGLIEPAGNDDFTDFQYDALAAILRDWSDKYGIPLERAADEQSPGIFGRTPATGNDASRPGKLRWTRVLDGAKTPLPSLRAVFARDTGEDLTELFNDEAKKHALPPELLAATAKLETDIQARAETWGSVAPPLAAIENGDRGAVDAALRRVGEDWPRFGLFLNGTRSGPDGDVPRTADAVLPLRDKYFDPSIVTPWVAERLGGYWKETGERVETMCRWRDGPQGCRGSPSRAELQRVLTEAGRYLDRQPTP